MDLKRRVTKLEKERRPLLRVPRELTEEEQERLRHATEMILAHGEPGWFEYDLTLEMVQHAEAAGTPWVDWDRVDQHAAKAEKYKRTVGHLLRSKRTCA